MNEKQSLLMVIGSQTMQLVVLREQVAALQAEKEIWQKKDKNKEAEQEAA